MIYKVKLIEPLQAIFTSIKTVKVSGKLVFPFRDDTFEESEILKRWCNAQNSLIDKKIDGLDEHEYFIQLKYRVAEALKHLRNNINPTSTKTQTLAAYQALLQNIDELINEMNTPSDYEVHFTNSDDEYLQEPHYVFENISYSTYKILFDEITNDCLYKLKREVSDDINLLQHSKSSVEFWLAFQDNIREQAANYLIGIDKIALLYDVLIDEVLDNVNFEQFLRCFDINNVPNNVPKYNRGFQVAIYHVLRSININNDMPLTHFGIENWYQYKRVEMPKSKVVLKKRIDNALKQLKLRMI